MLQMQTALQKAQWQKIKMWLVEKEEKWDAYHHDDIL